MGISDLTKILREYCPDCYVKEPINKFNGKRVAIDAHNLIYRYFSVQMKEEVKKTDIKIGDPNRQRVVSRWIWSIIDFGMIWLENGCTPIFVFDGTSRIEKDSTKKKRAEAKKVSKDNANQILSEIRSKDIFEIDTKLIEDAKKYMAQDTSIRSSELSLLIDFLKEFGFPVVISKHDAEQTCASLSIEGKVDGVFSTDSDTLTFGASLLITDFVREDKQIFLSCINLDIILTKLNFSFETFVDLCIMCGCDFNERIYGIGPKKSLNLLIEHENIDNIPDLDKSSLNVNSCREIFKYHKSHIEEYDLFAIPSKNINTNQDHNILKCTLDYKYRKDKMNNILVTLPSPQSYPYMRFPSNKLISIVQNNIL
jgi:flap endonuclease-1